MVIDSSSFTRIGPVKVMQMDKQRFHSKKAPDDYKNNCVFTSVNLINTVTYAKSQETLLTHTDIM